MQDNSTHADVGAAYVSGPVKVAYGGKPSLDYLLPVAAERLDYDPDTGVFRWRYDVGMKIKAGQVAGALSRNGYVMIGIGGKYLLAHRIAYYITHGHCPPVIDHVNGTKADNRATNLREASPTQNQHNAGARSDSRTGIRGVVVRYGKNGERRYIAQIVEDGKIKYLGTYNHPVLAWLHRVVAAQRIHGAFMCETSGSGMPPELIEFIGEHIVVTGRSVWRPKRHLATGYDDSNGIAVGRVGGEA